MPLGNAAGDIWRSWINPTSMLGGILAVLVCGYLAAVFLTADASRQGAHDLAATFRRRALASALLTGAVALGGIFILRFDGATLYAGLRTRAAPVVLLSITAGLVAILLLVRRRYWPARVASAAAVGSIMWGWGVAQYPYMLVEQITITEAAAHPATVQAVLVSLIVGSLLLVPSLVALFVLFQRSAADGETDNVTPQLPAAD